MSDDDLIGRLETATEGSIELDREIEAYLYPQHRALIFQDKWKVSPRSRSLDAALMLVPHGAVWHVMTDYGGLNRAKIGPAGRPSASVYDVTDRDVFIQADAETPALAVCIAALKARKVSEREDG